MASASSSNRPDIAALKTAIYEVIAPTAELDPKHAFYQHDLIALGMIPNNDSRILLEVVQALVNEKLFKPVNFEGGLGWRLRTVEEARKYRSLTFDQDLVYSLIDEAGSDGLWTKTIKARSGLHDALFRQAIKHLESKHMIAEMKSVEHPARKMYIKANLRPSERATGGPWYTNGELDMPFITHISEVCENYILQKSFYASRLPSSLSKKREPKKIKGKMTAEEAKALRDKELGPRAKPLSEFEKRKAEYDRMLPMPAGYSGYATCDEITHYLDEKAVSKTILTAMDVQQLLDIMVYDEKIEKVKCGGGIWGYRTLRKSLRNEDIGPQNLLTEAPCGRCPVFDLCEEGGPVGPSNCEYFNDWLSL